MEDLVNDSRWGNGSYASCGKRLRRVSAMTVDQFQTFIAEENIPETCARVEALQLTREDYYNATTPHAVQCFSTYLSCIMESLYRKERTDLLKILMAHKLPLSVYFCSGSSPATWTFHSRLDLFDLFLAQGHSIQEVRGSVEYVLAKTGNIDVLDYILERETGGVHILKSKIVYHACLFKRIDVLDRLFCKGYPVNKGMRIDIAPFPNTTMVYPIDKAFGAEYKSTDVLDRLIMMGVDLSKSCELHVSVLLKAYQCGANDCFQRLLDMGAKFNNRTDIIPYFDGETSPESLAIFVRAGMDLNYVTAYGTPLEYAQTMIRDETKRDEMVKVIEELGGR